MITNTLSSDTKDWLDSIRRDYSFKIICWEELDLEREVTLNRSQISERFPKIYDQADPVIVEEVIKKKQYVFSIRGVDQIEIVALDKPSPKKAKEDVIEFIKFLKANDVDYDLLQKKKQHSRKRES